MQRKIWKWKTQLGTSINSPLERKSGKLHAKKGKQKAVGGRKEPTIAMGENDRVSNKRFKVKVHQQEEEPLTVSKKKGPPRPKSKKGAEIQREAGVRRPGCRNNKPYKTTAANNWEY